MFASDNICTKQLSKIRCSSTANSSHIGVKEKAVVSFPFPYNYGTVIVQEVQQAVHVTKGSKEKVNQWTFLNVSSYIFRKSHMTEQKHIGE